jgi:2-dehydro-3-deoxyphosphogluconate aldolase/(4S)-4-hydroxy-2-oxoglutarate aldolase
VDKATTLERIVDAGVLAVMRAPSAEGAVRAADALVEGGVTGLEITYSTPDVPGVIARILERHGDAVVVGAGTLRAPAEAREAAEAGATFLVSPGLDDALTEAMRDTGALVMAGALTPTEVMRAEALGVDVVKVFPGSLVGAGYLRSLRGPFPDTTFMPTGGVSADNLAEWLAAGAVAVGAGGELCSAAHVAEERWDEVRANAERFMTALRAARGAS